MTNFFVLLNHSLTQAQLSEIEHMHAKPVFLPQPLQQKWAQIPPEAEIAKTCAIFCDFLIEHAQKGDFVLVQGEVGATFYMVDFCFVHQLIPLYASTKRVSSEQLLPNGQTEKKLIFTHCGFKKYEHFK